MITTLRPYQTDAVAELRAAKSRRVLLVLPTGAGKGTIVAFLITSSASKGKRVLFIVRGRQLVAEFSERLTSQYGVPHGVVMAGEAFNPHWPVQVCSIDTLVSRLRRGAPMPEADLVVIDEADEAVAPKWEPVLRQFPRAFLIGQTATPIRSDGRGLGRWFDDLVSTADVQALIGARYLNDFEGLRFVPDLNDAELRAARESQAQADQIIANLSAPRRAARTGNFVEAWHSLTPGRPTVGFAVNRADSREIVARFNAERVHGAPICVAVHIDGETPLEERREVHRRMREGDVHLVSSVGVLGRGVDWPVLEVAALWRPTKSLAWHLQACGRVLRTADCRCGETRFFDHGPGAPCGTCGTSTKRRAFFLDHVDNMLRHNHPAYPREWSLASRPRRPKKSEPAIRKCARCLAEFIGRGACPRCGLVPVPKPRRGAPTRDAVATIDIREKREIAPAERARRGLYALIAQALEHGRSPESGVAIWRARFHQPPPEPAEITRIVQHLARKHSRSATV